MRLSIVKIGSIGGAFTTVTQTSGVSLPNAKGFYTNASEFSETTSGNKHPVTAPELSEATSGSRRAETTPQVSHRMRKYFSLVSGCESVDIMDRKRFRGIVVVAVEGRGGLWKKSASLRTFASLQLAQMIECVNERMG